MTSGKLPILLLALICSLSAAGATSDADALLQRLARPAPATTAFVETKYSDLLDAPLVTQGELSFASANQLGKRVDMPFQERTVVDGENVSIERAGRKPMHFSLKRAPELRALLIGFSALLAGDRAALRRHFAIAVSGSDAHWMIVLDPIDKRIRKRIDAITIYGADDAPRCFLVEQADGDASVMRVDAAAKEAVADAASQDALVALCRQDAR